MPTMQATPTCIAHYTSLCPLPFLFLQTKPIATTAESLLAAFPITGHRRTDQTTSNRTKGPPSKALRHSLTHAVTHSHSFRSEESASMFRSFCMFMLILNEKEKVKSTVTTKVKEQRRNYSYLDLKKQLLLPCVELLHGG